MSYIVRKVLFKSIPSTILDISFSSFSLCFMLKQKFDKEKGIGETMIYFFFFFAIKMEKRVNTKGLIQNSACSFH